MTDLTDQLDAIDARLAAAAPGAITITPSDVAFLLVLARKQQAAIDAVREFIGWCDAAASREEEFYSKGKLSAIVTAERLREALEAKP